MLMDFDVRRQQEMHFLLVEALLWIIDYFDQKQWFKDKGLNDGFVSYKHTAFHFTRGQLMDWSFVGYLWIYCTGSIGEQVM